MKFLLLLLALDPQPDSKKMADGRTWTTANLNLAVSPSFCYDDLEANCEKYGRLYTWTSAQAACRALGPGWKLPANEDWRRLVTSYGPLSEDSVERAKVAFDALMPGGTSGFNAALGGGRQSRDQTYARLDAHGLYWTSTESAAATAWFYNFGRNVQAVNRHADGEKLRAFSVRCIRQ